MDSAVREARRIGEILRKRKHDVEEIIPPSTWSEDLHGYYLLLDLPGFKLEEVRLEVDNSGHIIISGERHVHNDKYKYFEQKFKPPENADIDNISGQFDGEHLNVTVPKKAAIEKKQLIAAKGHDNEDGKGTRKKKNQVAGFHEEIIQKWGQEASQMEIAIKLLKKNKMIIFTFVLAFSLGLLLSRRSVSNEQ